MQIGGIEIEINEDDKQFATRYAGAVVENSGATSFGVAKAVGALLSALCRRIAVLEQKGETRGENN
jgi:hypothetical protein